MAKKWLESSVKDLGVSFCSEETFKLTIKVARRKAFAHFLEKVYF